MAKNIRRMLAMVLVLCMFVSALPMQALAADGDGTVTETQTVTDGGLTTEITTSTTTSTDSSGNVTVTIDIQQSTSGENAAGASVSGEASSTSITVTDSGDTLVASSSNSESTTTTTSTGEDGTVTEQTVTEGSESETQTGLDVEIGDNVPTVEVTAKPGETKENTVTDTFTETEGDVPEDSEDPEYDYTETTTTVDRTLEVTLENEQIVIDSEISVEAVGPDDYKTDTGLTPDQFHIQESANQNHEGFDYQYIDYDTVSSSYVRAVKVVYKRNTNGEIEKDAEGNPVVDHFEEGGFGGNIIKNKDNELVTDFEELKNTDIYSPLISVMFLLQTGDEEDFESVYAYCCDLDIDPADNAWYTVANLEDSDYYPSEESEAHIRGIVSNGYWGTSNEPDEAGNYKTGSLALIKANLKQAIQNGIVENVLIETQQGENGEEIPIYLSSVIDQMTESEAAKATQAAIWSYSNGSIDVQNPKDGFIVLDVAYGQNGANAARVTALYNWLMQQTAEKTSTIINDQNFVEEVSLAVGKKVDEVTILNTEDNTTSTHGVYDTELNFTLAFVPTANDDLLVCLKYVDLDGNEQTLTKRLAGTNKEGETYDSLNANEDGSYTFSGLKLTEDQTFDFDLNLKGTQYLEQGVYIYTAQGGVTASQTMVGLAEGTQKVDATAKLSLSFNVDEEKIVHVERHWREESDPVVTPAVTTDSKPADVTLLANDNAPAPQVFRLANQNVEEIPEEPVPLAAPVITGDNSFLWIAVVVLSLFAMAVINFTGKKSKYEAF